MNDGQSGQPAYVYLGYFCSEMSSGTNCKGELSQSDELPQCDPWYFDPCLLCHTACRQLLCSFHWCNCFRFSSSKIGPFLQALLHQWCYHRGKRQKEQLCPGSGLHSGPEHVRIRKNPNSLWYIKWAGSMWTIRKCFFGLFVRKKKNTFSLALIDIEMCVLGWSNWFCSKTARLNISTKAFSDCTHWASSFDISQPIGFF